VYIQGKHDIWALLGSTTSNDLFLVDRHVAGLLFFETEISVDGFGIMTVASVL
jgi:hypothetical protein